MSIILFCTLETIFLNTVKCIRENWWQDGEFPQTTGIYKKKEENSKTEKYNKVKIQ